LIPDVSYTLWPSLYDLDHPYPVKEPWAAFVKRFAVHTPYPDKFHAPGFGPYSLQPPPTPCDRHPGPPRAGPHRCDRSVAAITAAVFDVDHHATEASLAWTDGHLQDAGVARLWYSSWSYPTITAFRLVLPLSHPVSPAAWPGLRHHLIDAFRIDADPDKCSGASHFYFGPSAPAERIAHAIVDVGAGGPVDVGGYLVLAPLRRRLAPPVTDVPAPHAPDDELDAEEARATLERVLRRWSNAPARGNRAALLRRLLAGEPLAEHGARNVTTLRTAGVVAHLVPEATLEALVEIFRGSLEAMQAEGSKLTEAAVERMLSTALDTARAREAQNARIAGSVGKWSREAALRLTSR
jgi:hypothetical protein